MNGLQCNVQVFPAADADPLGSVFYGGCTWGNLFLGEGAEGKVHNQYVLYICGHFDIEHNNMAWKHQGDGGAY